MQRFANHDAGVRHHGVQPAKSAHERFDCVGNGLFVAHVAFDAQDAAIVPVDAAQSAFAKINDAEPPSR